jgi:DUF1009 family protein
MTAVPQAAAAPDGPLGIICGAGTVPLAVAEAGRRRGRRVMLFALRGFADPQVVAAYPHHWVALGQLGRFYRLARAEGCRDLVMVGGLVRPSITQLRFDWYTLTRIPRIIRAFRGGDNHLLSRVSRELESEGFRVIGAHEIAPEITASVGVLGRHRPDADAEHDIDLGFSLLAATSPFDIGQAAVIARRHVLAVEAAEGTDAMLERIGTLRGIGRIRVPRGTGVLVKAPKRHQDRRYDLPSIGPDTVAKAAQAGLAGIAVVAGATIMAEPQRLIDAADRNGLFLVGRPDREANL